MANMKCYCCKDELTQENKSEEHILLNAIGGKLKSKNLLCKDCNSNFGESYDSELAKQLLYLSSFLNIKRDRGNHPTIKNAKTESGDNMHLLPGGVPHYPKPILNKEIDDEEIRISIKARNMKELESIAKSLNKKHPQIAVNSILNAAKERFGYINEMISVEIEIGGAKAFNAIIKMALNYYIYKSQRHNEVEEIIELLKSGAENDLCKYYFANKIYKKVKQEISHIIHIESNKSNKNIVAYVELFSSFSFAVMLNKNYLGKKIKYTYCYDVNHRKELGKEINFKISNEAFDKLPFIATNYNLVSEKINRVIGIGQKQHQSKEISSIIKRCIDEIFKKKYGKEKIINPMMTKDFYELLDTEFEKYLNS